MSRSRIWIALALLALCAPAAGCAGVGPTAPGAVDDVESVDQIDDASSALVGAPAPDDGSSGPERSAPVKNGDSAPSQSPSGKGIIQQDPDPCPWNQRHDSSHDT